MSIFHALLAANAVSDGLVAFAIVAFISRGGQKLSARGAIGAGLLTAIVCVAKAPLLVALDFNMFGLIHAAYLDVFIVVPLMAALLLALDWRGRAASNGRAVALTKPARTIALFTLIFVPAIGAYATYFEPFRMQLEQPHARLINQRAGSAALRIGVLADIQTASIGDFEHNAIETLMASQPDLIIIPGDLLQTGGENFQIQLPRMRELLSKLHAPAGVYFVSGDCEWRDGGTEIIQGLNITHLHNRIMTIQHHDRTITIGGVELDCHSPGAKRIIDQLESRPGVDDIRILASHRPDAALNAKPHSRIDLIIAGHTHGGQVNVPFFGPPITLSEVPRRVAAGGLHELNGNQIYVSRGLGHEGGQAPRIRFNCPPEITLLTMFDQDEASP